MVTAIRVLFYPDACSLSTYESLDQTLQRIEADEEDDKAMGKEISPEQAAADSKNKTKLNWRALRHASHTQLRHFAVLVEKRDIHILTKAIRTEDDARQAAMQAEPTMADETEAEPAAPETPSPDEARGTEMADTAPAGAADAEKPGLIESSENLA